MAECGAAAYSLSCSICLDVLKSPVTLHCGHSYCMDCVNGFWNLENNRGYSCPQCRCIFSTRPVLNKNTLLVDLVEKMEGATPKSRGKDGSDDVECDFCSGKKLKAVKSCLVCLASYCAMHVQPHYESAAFKRHKLVDASASIQDKICSKHDKLLEVYCRTDEECICLLCVMDEHKGHDTVSAASGRKEKQKLFGQKNQTYQKGIHAKEKQVQQLRQRIKAVQNSSDKALKQNEKFYAEVVSMAEQRRSAMKELISSQEKAELAQALALVDRLKKEIGDLKTKENDLNRLSLTEDNIYFLQHCKPFFDHAELDMATDFNSLPHEGLESVTKKISELRDKMETITKDLEEISDRMKADLDLEPKMRHEVSIYFCSITLDPNTAFEHLLLSEENTKVTWIKKAKQYPDHPERYTKYDQVLCSEALSGVCYFEVKWMGPRVEIAMCYKGAKEEESGFGYTDHSWCVSLSNSGCAFWHNEIKTSLPALSSSLVGVFLNHSAGSLSFYCVSDAGQLTLLHKVQTTFSQALYPGFMISRGASVKIISQE